MAGREMGRMGSILLALQAVVQWDIGIFGPTRFWISLNLREKDFRRRKWTWLSTVFGIAPCGDWMRYSLRLSVLYEYTLGS